MINTTLYFALGIFVSLFLTHTVFAQEFSVGAPWDENVIKTLYNVNEHKVVTEAVEVLQSTPFNILTTVRGIFLFPIDEEPLNQIAKKCSAEKNDWNKISCASMRLNAFINEKTSIGKLDADCKTFAYSFKKLANKLKIPGLFVQTEQFKGSFVKDGSFAPHVFNKLIFPSSDGQVYSYILDVGWAPNILFPKTELTVRRHSVNRNFSSLPTIGRVTDIPSSHCEPHSVFAPILKILEAL